MIIGPKIALVSGAFVSLTSFSGTGGNPMSSEALRQLDPSRIAGSICGEGARNARSRQSWLRIANMAVGAAAADGPVLLIEGLGDPGFSVSTQNPLAQRYFNQGLMLTYGFNHAEAIRAFREAQRLDPDCAMCWWGEANALGPNINAPMDPAANAGAVAAAIRADQLKARVRPDEQALIAAQMRRYSVHAGADRAELDRAYATAMLDLAAQFPENDTIAVLAAEAEMDVRPWDYWEPDRQTPKGRIGDAVRLVETVVSRSPDHPQAAHLYIHLMESTAHPQKAEAAADRLAHPLVPGSGHLVHMPGHLYYVLGRFKDSIRVNVEAARVDEAFLLTSKDRGLYRFGYYPHNVHFIVTSAQMAGDVGTALREAQRLRRVLSADATAATPWVQPVDAAPYLAYAQFASPKTILSLKAPDPRLPYVTAMWRYARAIAFARLRNDRAFDRELAALVAIRTKTDFKPMTDMLVPVPDLLKIAEHSALARREYVHGRYAAAAELYRQAASLEQGIPYYEPPYWYYPVRQSLGAALYRAGDLMGARQAFIQALAQFPNNGWALYGLAETDRALGDSPSEAAARAAFDRAWLGNPQWISMDRL